MKEEKIEEIVGQLDMILSLVLGNDPRCQKILDAFSMILKQDSQENL